MISFILCLALLIIGYFTYGKVVDNTFGPDDRETPAVSINDGVDYVVIQRNTIGPHNAPCIAPKIGPNPAMLRSCTRNSFHCGITT